MKNLQKSFAVSLKMPTFASRLIMRQLEERGTAVQ